MKKRPNSMAVLVSGITLLLATTTAKADSTFFSINFGYSNSHGHYASPYRYIYTPAYYYSMPSPFFFGYTSYYYPAFPYYYTPVVYYRPVFPYYYPYAYRPNWIYYNQHYAYRAIYPNSYIYGYYPYNRYYSQYPHKHYRYQPDHHRDHFYGHRNKQQYAGPYNKYLPKNRRDVQQRSGNRDIKSANVAETFKSQQSSRELDNRRTNLQQRPVRQRTERPAFRPSRDAQQTLAVTDPRPVLQRRQNNGEVGRFNSRDQRPEQSRQSEPDANNARLDRLINRDRKPSRNDTERNNGSIQSRQVINQKSDLPARAQTNTLDKKAVVTPAQARQNFQQRPARSNMESQGGSRSISQKTAVTERSKQYNQRQVVQQQPVHNNRDKSGNRNSSRQEQDVSVRSEQGKQARSVVRKKDSSSPETLSLRGGEQISSRGNNGYGMQQRQMPQRNFGGAGYRR